METIFTFTIGVGTLFIGIAVFFFSLLAVIWKGKSEIAAAIKDEISPFRNIANAITEIQTIIRSKFKGVNMRQRGALFTPFLVGEKSRGRGVGGRGSAGGAREGVCAGAHSVFFVAGESDVGEGSSTAARVERGCRADCLVGVVLKGGVRDGKRRDALQIHSALVVRVKESAGDTS